MKNNLIPFPKSHVHKTPRVEANDELKALRAAFDKARVSWTLEMAELPEDNKMYSNSKK